MIIFILVGTLISKITVCTHYEWLLGEACGAEASLTHYGQWSNLSQYDNRFLGTHSSWYCFEWYLVSIWWCNLLYISCHNRFIASNVWCPLTETVTSRSYVSALLDYFYGESLNKSYPPTNQRQLNIWGANFVMSMLLPIYDSVSISKKMHDNWPNRVRYCEASRSIYRNEMILHF